MRAAAHTAARHTLVFLRLMKWELRRLVHALRWPFALWVAACLLAVIEHAALGRTSYDEDPAFFLGCIAALLMAGRVLLAPLLSLCGKGAPLQRDSRFPLWLRLAAGLAGMVVALFAICFLLNFLLEAVIDFFWFYNTPLTASALLRGTRKLCIYLFEPEPLFNFLHIGVFALPFGCIPALGWVAAGSHPRLRGHRVPAAAGLTLPGLAAYAGFLAVWGNYSHSLRRLLGLSYGFMLNVLVLLALALCVLLVAATVLLYQKRYEPA